MVFPANDVVARTRAKWTRDNLPTIRPDHSLANRPHILPKINCSQISSITVSSLMTVVDSAHDILSEAQWVSGASQLG